MAYLTVEEEKRFATWLHGTPNPAIELLAEFKAVPEIESFEDLERLTGRVQGFFDVIRMIIYKNINPLPELPESVEMPKHKVTTEEILNFTAFCLVQAKISTTECQRIIHYCQYLAKNSSRKYNNKVHLETILIYLKEQNCLINDKSSDELHFECNETIRFLEEFFTPGDAVVEYLREEIPLSISEALLIQVETFLFSLKREVSNTESKSQSQEELQQKVNSKLGQLPSLLEQLIINNLGQNISIHSANDRKMIVNQFSDTILTTYPEISQETKENFHELIKQTHIAVSNYLQQFSIKKFANNLLNPLDIYESEELNSFKALFQCEVERLFKLGHHVAELEKSLENAVLQITQHANGYWEEEDPSLKQEKQRSFHAIINKAKRIFITKAILDPYESALNMRGLEISLYLKSELTQVYRALREEIEICLIDSEPEKLRERYGVCIAELAVLTQTIGNPTLSKEKKFNTINTLSNHIEAQHSIFPATIIYALRSLMGVARTSFLLDKIEAAVGFFRPNFPNKIDQKIKSIVTESTLELSIN
ncbi:hypothetical protein [Legionella drozanskii]|uniref:Uncharacterized protein n=1 Tax=Legionella drozanskii LLAP-1 TaxID=1212489 RepID=A0A0W0SWX8_9GAMM|nr:hypothetical protein [Legionella drozanskii]KTC87817.1 hypothetical protein Ldro_1436 [Legionella drozanskii LLAP-1]